MKHLYIIACLSSSLLIANAQTFSPVLKSTSANTFSHDFSQVKVNTSLQTVFTISGIANGSTFEATIDQDLDFVSNDYCPTSFGEPNFVITSGSSGTILNNKGTITVTFNPIDFLYEEPFFTSNWGTETFEQCIPAKFKNVGIKTATMTVTLYTPNAKDYIINLSGNSVSVVTALETETKIQHTLFYPNPVKDILHLNQEATVYDAFGKTILSGKGTMDVSGIHSGVYFVQSAGLVQKFVKE